MDTIIQTEELGRAFPVASGEVFWALKNISLSIPTGKLSVLKGRSGSGKTTLMNMLGALDRPTTGKVLFDGNILSAERISALFFSLSR